MHIIVDNLTLWPKLTPAPLWLKWMFIDMSICEHIFLVNSDNSLCENVSNFEVFMLF